MTAVITPQMLTHDRSLFLAHSQSETGVLGWWVALPQVVIQGPVIFCPIVLPSSSCSFQAYHAYLHQASGRNQSVEDSTWKVFRGQPRK